jgi:putative transposase
LPADLRQLITQMVRDNPTWGEERIADELWLKLAIGVSPRTVRAYWPAESPSPRLRLASQGWSTFVRNHAQAIVACDFMAAVTVRFTILYVLVVMEIGSRRIVRCGDTAHPTIRRECLDFMIPVNERHLRTILREWVSHYNKGRPSLQLTAGNSRPENGTTSHDTSPSF